MLKTILRWIYRRYQSFFLELIAEDFYKEIPASVTEPAIYILSDKKDTIKRWIYYQAFWIQRRIEKDQESSDKMVGILICFRLILKMLDKNTVAKPERKKKEKSEEESNKMNLDEMMSGVDNFVNKKKSEGEEE